jgi:small ligand-binding sensory domain FIST
MPAFRAAVAADADWRRCSDRVARQLLADAPAGGADAAALGFFYVTDHFAEAIGGIGERLAAVTRVADWVGCVGIGVVADDSELIDVPAITALLAPMPAGAWRLFATAADIGDAGGEALPFGIAHADPSRSDADRQIDRLAAPGGAFLVGGLASSRRPIPPSPFAFGGGAVSGVLFSAAVPVQIGLTQGCTPLGPPHLVTDARDHIVLTLDGRPAVEVFRTDIGEPAAADLRPAGGAIHAALPLAGSDRADYLVRNLVGLDPVEGWLAIGDRVVAGDRLMFVRRDPASARRDLERMLEDVARRLAGPPRGALYFSCIARGAQMFGRPGVEAEAIRRRLGPVPLAGFACGGEICNGRLYGYTGVLAVFT